MGNSSIQVFNSELCGSLRAVRDNRGEPWFVAQDVCRVLGTNVKDVRAVLDVDEVSNLDSIEVQKRAGRSRLIVSESGLYSLVLRSRKPSARMFKRWVTHDVLPAIRKSGGYIATDGTESNEELLARAVLVANDAIKRKDALIDKLAPKARFADAVAAADGTCLVGELAKMLRQNGVEVGQNRLFEWLRSDGYLGRFGSNWNVPTQRAMELGLFRIKETAVHKADGSVTISRTPKVTGKGQTYFFTRYAYGNEEPTD